MDDLTLDRVTRVVAQLVSRRTTLGGLVGAGVAFALGGPGSDTEAKKKKKKKKNKKCKAPNAKCGKKGCCVPGQQCRNGACQGPCIFTKTATTWTLQRDCVTQSPIDIPDGVTLDGDDHTITMQGPPISLPYGIGAQGVTATVRNLTLDGSGVASACGLIRGVGILINDAAAIIENSTIIGLASSCGDAIRINVFGGASPERIVEIDAVSIADAQVGINASGTNKLNLIVTDCDMVDVRDGIQVQYNVEATIDSNEIDANTYGVVILASAAVNAAPDVTATDNTVTGAQIGMSIALADASTSTVVPRLDATGNTIVGRGPINAGATHGLYFGKQAAGSATANTISNFFDSGANPGCGIFVADNAGAVDVDTNTFPNPQGTPPGNEQNICQN